MNGNPKMCLSPHDKVDFPPFFLFKYLFVYFWLCSVLVAVHRLSPVAINRDYCLVAVDNFSLGWLLLFQSTGSRVCGLQRLQHMGSAVVAWA